MKKLINKYILVIFILTMVFIVTISLLIAEVPVQDIILPCAGLIFIWVMSLTVMYHAHQEEKEEKDQ